MVLIMASLEATLSTVSVDSKVLTLLNTLLLPCGAVYRNKVLTKYLVVYHLCVGTKHHFWLGLFIGSFD